MQYLATAILAFYAAVASCPAAGKLQATAPAYLTLDDAREHLAMATIAALMTSTDPADLLSIAWHESRYQIATVTVEPGNRWSCGVMTPEPLPDYARCLINTRSALHGYLAGAAHLREWYRVCRGSRSCALRGYAGAYLHRCARSWSRACQAAADFASRARAIRW